MERRALLVAGLAFGDEGKGSIVDYLVREHNATLVVRYNGGAQAGHNVVTPDGKHHTFSQFGSGTFSGAHTYLSKHVIIEPMAMMNEAAHLKELGVDPWRLLSVDGDALVITPFQRAAARIIERGRAEGGKAHGSCGIGIGQTRGDHLKFGDAVVFAKDLKGDSGILRKKLQFMREESMNAIPKEYFAGDQADEDWYVLTGRGWVDVFIRSYEQWPAYISEGVVIPSHSTIVFEGAQGMLLDERFGTAPHNTWTDITFTNANELLAENEFEGQVKRVGVVRSYYTRHGAGPFPTEDNGMAEEGFFPELHNTDDGFQGKFRKGYFDWKSFNYALRAIGGVDVVAVNHLDKVAKKKRMDFAIEVAEKAHVVPIICGMGPTADNKISMSPQYQYRETLEGLLCGQPA